MVDLKQSVFKKKKKHSFLKLFIFDKKRGSYTLIESGLEINMIKYLQKIMI